jgi:hypothetical protein
VDGATFAPAAPIQVTLTPGPHSILADGGAPLTFRVAGDGTVYYDTNLEGILTGRGTRDLSIQGRGVTLDASGLISTWVWVDGVQLPNSSALALRLLPGRHTFQAEQGPVLVFNLTTDGMVTDPTGALNGLVSGLGTPRLTVTGQPVTVDASRLGVGQVWIDGLPFNFRVGQPVTLGLLPGRHTFSREDGVVHHFDVDGNGNFIDDAEGLELRGIASGFGTNRLTLS